MVDLIAYRRTSSRRSGKNTDVYHVITSSGCTLAEWTGNPCSPVGRPLAGYVCGGIMPLYEGLYVRDYRTDSGLAADPATFCR
jgi:hypothetical protein